MGQQTTMDGGTGLEDGFRFARNARLAEHSFPLGAVREGRSLFVLRESSRAATLMSAEAPGQPAPQTRRFHLIRVSGTDGMIRSVISWARGISGGSRIKHGVMQQLGVGSGHGREHTHLRDDSGWHITTNDARTITLAGFRKAMGKPAAEWAAERAPERPTVTLRASRIPAEWWSEMTPQQRAELETFDLNESHYRRSELSWRDAGAPAATVSLATDGRTLVILADVRAGDPHFAPADATNPFDNEHPDTMAAGIQLHLQNGQGRSDWMFVPESRGDQVRVRAIRNENGLALPNARWRRSTRGYEMRIELPLPEGDTFDFDVIVNETTAARRRRRGQLVLSGADGEFVYLRGDRHDPGRALRLAVKR
jgi:hypothetical protein